MPPSLDQARAALAAQPFSRLLGAQLNRFGPDGVELEVPVRPAHRQQHGFSLLARAWVISAGRRLIVTGCELIEPHPDGDLLSAIAQGIIARTT